MVKVSSTVAFALGLALLGIGLPDLLGDTAKFWVTVAGAVLLVAGVVLVTARAVVSRWTVVRRHPPRPATHTPAATADLPQPPTRQPLIRALEEHAVRLRDMLDARFAESPGPKGGLVELVRNREAFDAAAPARAEHDRHTLAIYFEKFRTPGLALFDEAVNVWWAGNPKLRPAVERPSSADDLRKVENIFARLAHNLREKETDRAMEARGFVKQYVAVDRKE